MREVETFQPAEMSNDILARCLKGSAVLPSNAVVLYKLMIVMDKEGEGLTRVSEDASL